MNVFLSYTEADAKWAGQLRAALASAGYEVWNPAADLEPGHNWHLEVGRALERSDAMVVLLSPSSVHSPSVVSEIEYALSDARFRGRLIPVLVKPTADIPWILRRLPLVRATKDAAETAERIAVALGKSPVAAVA
jgi:hypothetical protein